MTTVAIDDDHDDNDIAHLVVSRRCNVIEGCNFTEVRVSTRLVKFVAAAVASVGVAAVAAVATVAAVAAAAVAALLLLLLFLLFVA